ncbi:MAG: hypothetical protein MAG795_00761 [Candidatus Woesearchaeota archaeon]|nr:hypothetical protein [Candidatus Woesearchaeota archaeon]
MSEESFLLMSLKDKKSKKLAQVISNETSRKILDYLSKKKATETEMSEKLDIPLSTIHYNLKHLLKAKLVVTDEYHYSEKGKEVNHYSLANKYIIITPGKVPRIKQKLRSILPAISLAALSAAALQIYQSQFSAQKISYAQDAAISGAKELASTRAAQSIQYSNPNNALYFLGGAVLVTLLYFLFDLLYSKLSK